MQEFIPNACSPVMGIQKSLSNGPIKQDSVKRLLNVQLQCHMSEQGQACA